MQSQTPLPTSSPSSFFFPATPALSNNDYAAGATLPLQEQHRQHHDPLPPTAKNDGPSAKPATNQVLPALPDLPVAIARSMRSEAARSYAPFPFALKRLFFSPTAGDTRMGNRKLRLIHRDPHVYMVEDFLAESEYEHFEQIIEQNFGKFRNSYTDENVDEQHLSASRTSAFISLRKGGGSKVRSVEARAAEIVGLTPEHVEPLQMVGYRMGDHFDTHHDMGTFNKETGLVEAVSPRRLVTFFVYLNTLPRGQGHTTFPQLHGGRFSVRPQRLNALLFCNVLENGEPDPRLVHRADPVREEGMLKFGINVWVVDKNLQALAFSSGGTVLDANKVVPGKRTILAMIDAPCEVCKKRERPHAFQECDSCSLSYHRDCLPADSRPPARGAQRTFWTCPRCVGKKPRPGDFCEECGGGDREHLIVLCDTCEKGWHTTCLGLRKVPKDAYFCAPCQAKQAAKELAAKAREEGGCQLCGQDNEPEKILLCDGCDGEFHLACVGLKRVPRNDWFCSKTCRKRTRTNAS